MMNASSNAPSTTTAAALFLLMVVGGRSAAAQVVLVRGGEGSVGRNDDSAPGGGGDTHSFPDRWNDLWKLEEPLDWKAFLYSDLLKRERSNRQTRRIIQRTSASISIIASALLIAHLLVRSHQGLSTTYHRLMFGLSIADVMFSSSFVVFALMVPKEMDYIVPGAQGTVDTCTAQGFFSFVGALLSTYYNCSICCYYLAIIKYNRSDAYIAKKLERWLHAIPITLSLLYGFLLVAVKGFNTSRNGGCFSVPHNLSAPHCIGVKDGDIVEGFSIPCGRGNGYYNSIMYQILFFAVIPLPPIIIITTMFMMYRTVLKIGRNAARYGVSTLRLNVRLEREQHGAGSNECTNQDAPDISQKIQDCISCFCHSLRHLLTCRNNSNNNDGDHNAHACFVKRCWMRMTTRPPRRRLIRSTLVSRKKAVLQMASGYVAAWALVWVPYLLVTFAPSHETRIITGIFSALQGLFNFIVFMSPKVRDAKMKGRRRERQTKTSNVSWFKAAFSAYMSRGERRRP